MNNHFIYYEKELYLTVKIENVTREKIDQVTTLWFTKDYLYNYTLLLVEDNTITLGYIPWLHQVADITNIDDYIVEIVQYLRTLLAEEYYVNINSCPLLITQDNSIKISYNTNRISRKNYIHYCYTYLINLLTKHKYQPDNKELLQPINIHFRKYDHEQRIKYCTLISTLNEPYYPTITYIQHDVSVISKNLSFHRENIKQLFNYYLNKYPIISCEIFFLAADLYYQSIYLYPTIDLEIIKEAMAHYFSLPENSTLRLWSLLGYINTTNYYYHVAYNNNQLKLIFSHIILNKTLVYYHIKIQQLQNLCWRDHILHPAIRSTLTMKEFYMLL